MSAVKKKESAFALAITLVLLALIVIVVVAYLASTRIERSTSSVYTNRLRAKITADSGLTAAIHLLHENTRFGNYITAMPAPSPSPVGLYTEIYRPQEPSPIPASYTPDYLRMDNALGDVLVSRSSSPSGSPLPQVDPRPTPQIIPAPPSSFAISNPGLTATNSYDFNQIARLGLSSAGRLVQPFPSASPPAAFGQWVQVRNSAGNVIGRYAFYIEDESMKINVNVAGNNTGGSNLRVNDLILPATSPAPATQIEEIDPSFILPTVAPTPNRVIADTTLVGLGSSGGRLSTRSTLGLLNQWGTNFPDYAHMATVLSRDDTTTARGWQRLDVNALVAGATNNTAKAAVATRIANWIRDAWTGPTSIANLQDYQMFNDDRLRLQIAANIVDYIDADSIPTDLGDVSGYPVIGIEKIPYLVELDVIYAATGSSGQANIGMSFRFNFFNMFESDLRLSDYVGSITIKGVPSIIKNGAVIFDHEAETFTITVGDPSGIPDGVVPWGGDNVASGVAGVKTFQTGQVLSQPVTYTPGGTITRFESGLIEVNVLGKNGERLDSTKIALRDLPARWDDSSASTLDHDFLEVSNSAASINGTWEGVVEPGGTINPIDFGDPRYRASVITKRWYNLTRTDTTRFATSNNLAEMDSRAYSVDWYDYIGNRPLLFHRNGPMLSIGELGNVSVCEYPWRTVYLQYAGRSHNTNETDIIPEIQNRRGSSTAAQTNSALLPQDYDLVDLFKTSPGNTRSGALNINSQFVVTASPTPVPTATPIVNQGAFNALFNALPAGGGVPGGGAGGTPTPLNAAATNTLSTIVAGRRSAVAPLVTGGPGAPGGTAPIDNNPRRPYFTIGQLASDISWLINQSANSTMTGNSRTRTTVNYSLLRNTPTSSTWNRNYGSDMQVEGPFRKVSNSITTRGNIFRILYVGQTLTNGIVQAEYLGEAFVERHANFVSEGSNPDAVKTSGSTYTIIANRVITE